MTTTYGLGYRPALDGVRAVAILAVLARHSGLLPAGYLGVDIFFALSGFLITSLLVEEYAATGTIALRLFYARRALRLLPALLGLLIVCTIVHLATLPPEWGPLALQQAAVVLFYVANWAWAIGLPLGLYSHAWSLAIEEQFYVLWPLALLGLLRVVHDRRVIVVLVLAAAGVGVVWRLALVRAHATFQHVYEGLDAHGDGLLIGCAAGLLLGAGAVRRARGAGLVGVIGIAAMLALARFPDDYLHRHVSTVASLATALLVVHVWQEPRSVLARGLAAWPLAALGRISYGVYLWHFPVFYWCGALSLHDDSRPWPAILTAWVTTLAVAVASYAVIERPALALKSTLATPTGAERMSPA
jgi:peptidoglycan/LPS O-acetylase OafA/YrhL